MSRLDALGWGMELVQELVPQRVPLLMVDSVLCWQATRRAMVVASRIVDAAEPVFAGHFPGHPVWPGVFTIEGLAQTCRILATLERLAEGCDRGQITARVDNLQRWIRHDPRADAEVAQRIQRELGTMRGPGLLVAVEIRLTHPVLPGCRLEYRATCLRAMDGMIRFQVEALVGSDSVAHGTVTTVREQS
jgi:3-hydroxyacyl-[acyl-carrier-protein] dehydratase